MGLWPTSNPPALEHNQFRGQHLQGCCGQRARLSTLFGTRGDVGLSRRGDVSNAPHALPTVQSTDGGGLIQTSHHEVTRMETTGHNPARGQAAFCAFAHTTCRPRLQMAWQARRRRQGSWMHCEAHGSMLWTRVHEVHQGQTCWVKPD